jgi:hypothetical protein
MKMPAIKIVVLAARFIEKLFRKNKKEKHKLG